MELTNNSTADSEKRDSREEPGREEEGGDVAEPDAPTAEEENEGMNTVLDANPLTGVQTDATDE